MRLSKSEIAIIVSFVERQVDQVDESLLMTLGKGLDKSHNWDEKLKWKLDIEFAKLREIKAIIDKHRDAEIKVLMEGE